MKILDFCIDMIKSLSLPYKTGLTLHDFCRATDQIGYDIKH